MWCLKRTNPTRTRKLLTWERPTTPVILTWSGWRSIFLVLTDYRGRRRRLEVVTQTESRREGGPTRVGCWLAPSLWFCPGKGPPDPKGTVHWNRVVDKLSESVKKNLTSPQILRGCWEVTEEGSVPESGHSVGIPKRSGRTNGRRLNENIHKGTILGVYELR